jgi:hypothetical protein
MSGAQEAGMQDAGAAVDRATSSAARFAAHLGVAVAGLLLGAVAGVVVALAFGLIPFQC